MKIWTTVGLVAFLNVIFIVLFLSSDSVSTRIPEASDLIQVTTKNWKEHPVWAQY